MPGIAGHMNGGSLNKYNLKCYSTLYCRIGWQADYKYN